MQVLLIQPAPPPALAGDSLPIGLACIASFLRKHGVDACLIDLGKRALPDDISPDVVGIGATTPYYANALRAAKGLRVRYPRAWVILGGPHFMARPEDAFPYADVVVEGDGELAMLEICRSVIGTLARNSAREFVLEGDPLVNLDDVLPFDDDLLDCLYAGRQSRLHVIGARGCPFSCTFCAEHARQVRYHSVEGFVDLLEIVAKRYHNNIFIADDVFTLDVERAASICVEIIRRDLDLHLQVFGHVRCFDKNLLPLMKDVGVHRISYGIESGNDAMLRRIGKGFTAARAAEVVARTAEAGLSVGCLYMVGNIGETRQTLADTVAFARKVGQDRWCSFALPLPGTQFAQVAEHHGTVLTEEWTQYTNQNVVFVPRGLTERDMRRARDAILGRTLGDRIRSWGERIARRKS